MFVIEFRLKLSSMYSIRLPYSYQSARTYPLPAPSTIKGMLANALWQLKGGNPVDWLKIIDENTIGATSRSDHQVVVTSCMVRIVPMDALLRQFAFTPYIDCLVLLGSEQLGKDISEGLKLSPIYIGDSESLATVIPDSVFAQSADGDRLKNLRIGEAVSGVNTLVLADLVRHETLQTIPEGRSTPLYMQEDPLSDDALLERYLAPLNQNGDSYIPLDEFRFEVERDCMFIRGERLTGVFRKPKDKPSSKQNKQKRTKRDSTNRNYQQKKETMFNISRLTLKTEHSFKPEEVVGLRGYIGREFEDITLFHHHKEDGFLYSYPFVQYKVLNGKAIIIGIREGTNSIKRLKDNIDSLRLGDKRVEVKDMLVEEMREKFGITKRSISYTFLTPWLALNQKNYREWQRLSKEEKQEMLKKTLIGNILSMAKGLEYVVTEEIKAEVDVKPVPTTLKGVPMVGFLGEFWVNFNIPDYLGIGKSVSRGFGTVIQRSEY